MCLIISKPRGLVLPKEHLEHGYSHNDDGWGIAYCDGPDVKIRKATGKFENFWATYEHVVRVYPDSPLLIHFRLATHGARDSSMCHPFYMQNGWALAHNGIIGGYHSKGRDSHLSDTAIFIRDRMDPLMLKHGDLNPKLITMLEEEIGGWNKVALLRPDGDTVILNRDKGHEKDGIWYSNDGYEAARTIPFKRYWPKEGGWTADDHAYRDDGHRRTVAYNPERWRSQSELALEMSEKEQAAAIAGEETADDPVEETYGLPAYDTGLLECSLCNGHIKGRFHIVDDTPVCPECLALYNGG